MQIQDRIIPLIEADHRNQQVLRLHEWEKEFPEMTAALSARAERPLIKQAVDEGQWLMASFLLRRQVPNKIAQVQASQDSPYEACSLLIRAVVQDHDTSKLELLSFLQERVRL